ncbi:MAG TPA: hypothetical protein VE757_06175, partial [Gaiellaceae bacterium]|nr:hypothetical protein [Gaiellaceae bacterium]
MPIRATWLVAGAGLALAAPGATAGPSVPATSHLIFTSNRDGDAHAYATDPAGRRLAALTVGTRDDSLFVVSRDGRHIAFRRSERRGFGVYVADGGGRHLARVGQGDPVGWSPNGSLLAFFFIGGSVVEPTGISVVGADGTGARKLVGGEGSYTEFDGWSPDGQELAYTVEAVDPSTGDIDTELRTVDLAGTEKVLSSQLGETWFSAAWAPSGHRLAYRRFADGGSQVAVVDADTGATSVVAKGSDAFGPPVWSPDGTKLLYSRGDAGANSLEVADLGTGATTQLVRTAYVDYEPTPAWAWSPAGDRVVWS